MLVLSRRKNESLILGNDAGVVAKVMVVDIRGDKARLGIEAGSDLAVHREEVWDAIKRSGGTVIQRPGEHRHSSQSLIYKAYGEMERLFWKNDGARAEGERYREHCELSQLFLFSTLDDELLDAIQAFIVKEKQRVQ